MTNIDSTESVNQFIYSSRLPYPTQCFLGSLKNRSIYSPAFNSMSLSAVHTPSWVCSVWSRGDGGEGTGGGGGGGGGWSEEWGRGRGGRRTPLLLASVIRPSITHPFRDGLPFLPVIKTLRPQLLSVQYVSSILIGLYSKCV